jgi:two-component system sensor histidine kinase YesM
MTHNYRIKNLGISFKLVVSTALLILSSVFLVSYLSYIKYTDDFKEQSSKQVQQTLDQVSLNIDTYLDDLFRLSLSPYYNDDVIDALDRKIDDDDLQFLSRERTIENFLDQMMIFPREDILRVFIITDRIYKSERIPSTLDNTLSPKKYDWYTKALETEKPIFVPAHLEQLIKKPKHIVFSVVNKIKSTRNLNRILGIIKVDANYSRIASICEGVNTGDYSGLFIIDENKNIIFSSLDNIPYDEYLNFYRNASKTKDPYILSEYNEKHYLLNIAKTTHANWSIIGVNSLNEINKKAVVTRNNSFLMAFFCSIFAIFILVFFIKWFLNPLLCIVSRVRKVEAGDFTVKFPSDKDDEIGYLGTSLNDMVKRIDYMMRENTDLVKQVYEAKYLQKEAQVKNLFNQIRPHFIYNTLNMISLFIQCGKEDKAVDNINKLSSILRGMSHLDKDITLEYELKLLDSYLSIQYSRFDGRLKYSINIDAKFNSYIIPALLFQPIVENAVIHGCEAKKDLTDINIFSHEESDKIIFTIEDNGIGMTKEELNTLRSKIYNYTTNQDALLDMENRGSGIGLINVHKRIQIKYGKDYGLHINSTFGVGTIVRLTLPRFDYKGGYTNV